MDYMTSPPPQFFFFFFSFQKTEVTEDLACQYASDSHWSLFWDAAG